MSRTSSSIRRAAATIAMAGAATFGAVALAPAASAAQPVAPVTPPAVDGSSYTVEHRSNGGPDSFLVTPHGRKAVFFCDAGKPNQRHGVCQADPESAPDRF